MANMGSRTVNCIYKSEINVVSTNSNLSLWIGYYFFADWYSAIFQKPVIVWGSRILRVERIGIHSCISIVYVSQHKKILLIHFFEVVEALVNMSLVFCMFFSVPLVTLIDGRKRNNNEQELE